MRIDGHNHPNWYGYSFDRFIENMDQKIIEDVKKVAYEVLKDERALSEEDFNMIDSENMDSIHRVSILTALEEEYDIIFKLKEISSWNTINELAAILEKKL